MFATACQRYIQETDQIDRILIRGEISEHEKGLSSTANLAGVTTYSFFQNAGYRGLYNMNLSRLKELKMVPAGRSLLDFMGKDEPAMNLFRITQIKREGTRGQQMLENAAESAGRIVRKSIQENSGQRPEQFAGPKTSARSGPD